MFLLSSRGCNMDSLWIRRVWLYGMGLFNDFGCSELMLRKVWQSVLFLNILVGNLLCLMYSSVTRDTFFSFDILYTNLIGGCFVFNSFKKFSRSVLIPLPKKNISSKNVRYISENVLINEDVNFLSKWSIKMFAYEGAQTVPMAQPFICK